jgi:hypothetical protein
MGEANRRRESTRLKRRQQCLRELKYLEAPASEGEVETYYEVQSIVAVKVPRQRLDLLAAMGMMPNECHANAYAAAQQNDSVRVVTGWWCDTPISRLHSIIDQTQHGGFVCITPGPLDILTFRPDPLVELRSDGNHQRAGRRAPTLLRSDPKLTIEAANEARTVLDRGGEVEDIPLDLLQVLGMLWQVPLARSTDPRPRDSQGPPGSKSIEDRSGGHIGSLYEEK